MKLLIDTYVNDWFQPVWATEVTLSPEVIDWFRERAQLVQAQQAVSIEFFAYWVEAIGNLQERFWPL